MFSFRRRSSKKAQDVSQIRTSPSLPEMNSEGIPWPKNLVDVASIRQTPPPDHPQQGAAKTSFQGVDSSTIPFHKPFRGSPGKPPKGPIFSLYMNNPPSAFDRHKSEHASLSGRYSQKRARVPPTFNLMVLGAKGTGKTSLLRLLLETADISPNATADQRSAVDRFLRGTPKHTESIQTACAEISESRFDRLLLTVIDTPGLDFEQGHELKLERQVTGIMKYIDSQYAETMGEESKVVRQSKGDQHIHLCIYMIDPSSVITEAARRASAALPTRSRSEATLSYRVPDLVPDESGDSEDESRTQFTLSPADIRVIRRISARSNVIPVIAQADSLTDETLAAVRDAVRRGLAEAGLDFGVLGPESKAPPTPTPTPKRQTRFADTNGHIDDVNEDATGSSEDEAEERTSRPVVRLRANRHRSLSRSRSRRDLSEAALDARRPILPDPTDNESVANVRFYANTVAQTDFTNMMPFALINPQTTVRHPRPVSTISQASSMPPITPAAASEDGHSPSVDTVPYTPASVSSRRNSTYLDGPPDDLKGVFVRKYRWGTIDVLNPDHCDFSALRTAILSTHLKVLKLNTKEVLYEKYRTEKLLARRATSNITEQEQQRLFQELGL